MPAVRHWKWLTVFPLQHDAVTNLRKAKSLYITRQQEFEKAKEATQKAENESLSQSTAGQAAKFEKKRKLEDEALTKVQMLAEAYSGWAL